VKKGKAAFMKLRLESFAAGLVAFALDELALSCADVLSALRALIDENSSAAWAEELAGFDDALARLAGSRAN
jgi:hypothetical protein